MKIKVEIDCTPQEARSFFGLPDLEPLNEAMTEKLQERMEAAAEMLEPEALLKAWMPGGAGYDQMRNMFMGAMGQAAGQGRGKKPGRDDE